MREAVDIGWRLGGLALAWVGGVALHLQQRSLWPMAACVAAIGLGALGLMVAPQRIRIIDSSRGIADIEKEIENIVSRY